MIHKNKMLGLFFLATVMSLFLGCAENQKNRVIKLGHGLDITHPVHKAMIYMADRLKEKSDGTLLIDIYPNQQLGSERETLELLRIGSLGMTKVSTATMENFVPEFRVLGLPFLFEDEEHRFRVLEGAVGEDLLNASLDKRLKGLTFYDAGSRSFYSKVPIKSPEDLEGLKIRVMESNTAITMVKSLGGSPTPIAWGELYSALQQGIVDGAENNLPSFYLSRHYEVCKYFTMDKHTAVPDELLISRLVWNSLNEQEKSWVKEAAMESSEYQKKLWKEAEQEALENLKKAGVQFFYPKKSQFKEQVKPIYDEFNEDPTMKNLIKKIQNLE